MSKHDKNCPPDQSLTDFKLDLILEKVEGIEFCLYGDGARHDGVKLEVDRIKRSHNAMRWVMFSIFTTIVAAAGTVITSMIVK